MSPEKRRAIAAMGGKSVNPASRSFSVNCNLAIEAGRKGGKSVPEGNRSFSRNRDLAAEAGRKGGKVSGERRRAAKDA